MATGPREVAPFWTGFWRSLIRRGLRGVKLVFTGLGAAAGVGTEQKDRHVGAGGI